MYQYSSNVFGDFFEYVSSLPPKKRKIEINKKMKEIYNSEAQLRLVAPPNIISEVESLTVSIVDFFDLWNGKNKVEARKALGDLLDVMDQKNKITNLMRADLGVRDVMPK